MKNRKYWHDLIRTRLILRRDECLVCLRPENDWTWGTTRKNLKRTLELLNCLLKDVPIEAWPRKIDGECDGEYRIAHNNWVLRLFYGDDGRREADLVFKKDDHTAWVKESSKEKGKFIDCDIGGS